MKYHVSVLDCLKNYIFPRETSIVMRENITILELLMRTPDFSLGQFSENFIDDIVPVFFNVIISLSVNITNFYPLLMRA